MPGSRNWCFTSYATSITVPDGGAAAEAAGAVAPPNPIKYMVVQQEQCPETKNMHWQGYAEFYQPVTYKQAQRLIGDEKAHMESRKGTRDEARAYCMKIESRVQGPFEFGDFKAGGQGKRTDIENVAAAVKSKKRFREIAEEYPVQVMKFHRGIKVLQETLNDGRSGPVKVLWLWGASHVGKSWHALRLGKLFKSHYWRSEGGQWWTKYDGEPCVVIDEYDGSYPFKELLSLFSEYPYNASTKGGFTVMNARRFIVTSNEQPRYYHSDPHGALSRRIREVQITARVDNLGAIDDWFMSEDIREYLLQVGA